MSTRPQSPTALRPGAGGVGTVDLQRYADQVDSSGRQIETLRAGNPVKRPDVGAESRTSAGGGKGDPFRLQNFGRVRSVSFGLANVRNEVLFVCRESILAREPDVMALPGSIPGLSPGDSGKLREYLYRFFEKASNREKILDEFEDDCLEP